MSIPITTPSLPHAAIYRRNILHWNNNGTKFFTQIEVDVDVIAETEKSFQIRYKNNRLSWVGKNKVKFVYLSDRDFCGKKQRRMPPLACRICHENCALRNKDYPQSSY